VSYYEALLGLLIIALVLGFVYFTNGRTLTEKVLAIEFMGLMGSGLMLVFAVAFNDPVYLDVVIVWALVAFLGAVAFIYYVLKNQEIEGQKKVDEIED
jgi:multicomponent Na+:H+ antiporter subunit F